MNVVMTEITIIVGFDSKKMRHLYAELDLREMAVDEWPWARSREANTNSDHIKKKMSSTSNLQVKFIRIRANGTKIKQIQKLPNPLVFPKQVSPSSGAAMVLIWVSNWGGSHSKPKSP
jgi:hypothetical protein